MRVGVGHRIGVDERITAARGGQTAPARGAYSTHCEDCGVLFTGRKRRRCAWCKRRRKAVGQRAAYEVRVGRTRGLYQCSECDSYEHNAARCPRLVLREAAP